MPRCELEARARDAIALLAEAGERIVYVVQRRLPLGDREWTDHAVGCDEQEAREFYAMSCRCIPPPGYLDGFAFRVVRRRLRDEVLCQSDEVI